MLLVESLKIYAGTHRTSKAIYSYLETEDMVAKFDAYIQVEDITEEWIMIEINPALQSLIDELGLEEV
jgi:hypothetical protein